MVYSVLYKSYKFLFWACFCGLPVFVQCIDRGILLSNDCVVVKLATILLYKQMSRLFYAQLKLLQTWY